MPSTALLRGGAILAVVAALAVAPPAFAQAAAKKPAKPAAASAPAAADAGVAALQKTLEQKFPGAGIRNVARTPYFGLYEAQIDDQMIYTDAKAAYVVVGAVYDTETKRNLTEARQRELNRIAFSSLPLDLAIKKVKGNGERRIAVFSDADCPFCARLENEFKNVDNVTIYTFLYPIDQLHPDAARKSKVIWCAPDKVRAWDEFFVSGKLPDNAGDCATPIEATAALGAKLRVTATPTLVFADGSIIPGALPAAQIEQQIRQSEVEAKKLAGASK
ncbi:MAG: DsbC family protein [Betaproteobacteria bacterium]|jgi:thiol:disulfide interchange protein DsbC|nr:DsbC family protein [Betaproteobacteria bacterium]MBK7081585.1 DsbC family protein [Betaproteobacteria bacterium]MBK7744484.1 DsbC family protein [Betaproteobacteria bacterium]